MHVETEETFIWHEIFSINLQIGKLFLSRLLCSFFVDGEKRLL